MFPNQNKKHRNSAASNTNSAFLTQQNQVLLSDNRSLKQKSADLVKVINSVILPDSVTTFGEYYALREVQPLAHKNILRIYNPNAVRSIQKEMFHGARLLGVTGAPVDSDTIRNEIEHILSKFNFNALTQERWNIVIPKIRAYLVKKGVMSILATGLEYMISIENIYDQYNYRPQAQFMTQQITQDQVGMAPRGDKTFIDTYGSARLKNYVSALHMEKRLDPSPADGSLGGDVVVGGVRPSRRPSLYSYR